MTEGRYLELRFDTPARRLLAHQRTFNRTSGPERREAKYRFLDVIYPHLTALKAQRDFILLGDVNIAHQAIDLKNWKSNQKNWRLPRGTRLDDPAPERGRARRRSRRLSRHHGGAYTWVEQPRARPGRKRTWAGDWTISPPGGAALARHVR